MSERTKTAPNWEILTVGAAMLAAVSTMALYLGGRIDAQGLEMGGRIDGLAAAQRETGERLARLEALAFGPPGLGGGPPTETLQP
ncbi:MAG: hypothetical protein J4G09_15745 [Proteobacteria bacterium]|nr:hypothetical protein [Pseudomonadota bacterium]